MKKKIMPLILCALLLLLFTGCARERADSGGQNAQPVQDAGAASETAPLTGEELKAFRVWLTGTEELLEQGMVRGSLRDYNERIGCFFTSHYSDVRDLDLGAFIAYCFPAGEILEDGADDAEFQALSAADPWEIVDESGTQRPAAKPSEMPFPVRRFPVAELDALLTEYAGITVDDLRTNWKETLTYLPEYDAFYGGASDYGPGTFYAAWGEKSADGNTVTLYEAEGGDVLTLRKSGNSWLIVSHLPQSG